MKAHAGRTRAARWIASLDRPALALLLAFGLLVAALFMPAVELDRDAFDHIVVFDLTQSMNVEDYELGGTSVSRLAYAREAARRALGGLPCGSRVGWGAFAEYRSLVLLAPVEVCENYNDLLLSLDQIDGRMRWANASEVAKGLFWAVRGAKELGATADATAVLAHAPSPPAEGGGSRSDAGSGNGGDRTGQAAGRTSPPNIIFLTDGHESPPLGANARPAFDDVKPGEVHGWVVGVGGPTPRPIPRFDAEGRPLGHFRAEDVIQQDSINPAAGGGREHLSGLREAHLKALATQVGFDYTRLEDLGSLARAMRDPRLAQRRPVATDLYWLPASLAFLVLLWRFRPAWRWRRVSRPARAGSSARGLPHRPAAVPERIAP